MDEPSKPPSAGAFLDLESDFSPTIGVRGFDADTLKHLNAIMRAYYNTLLIEPVPSGLLGLLGALDKALKRRS
jgi:hypothetical protein